MAINLDAIKQKLNSLQNVTSKSNNLWKPEPGTQVIRIIPYQHNRENPFQELYFHYNFGGKSILSPISFGRPDPIVEFAEKLKSTGNSDDWKSGKKLEPTMRCYVPIIVRGKESEGVKFWGFGKQIYTELLSIVSDPDYGDITDLMNGRDIDVEFTPAEGANFPKTTIRVKPATSAATEDKEIATKIMTQPEITDLFPEPTYEELETALKEWMNPENADADVDSEEAPATPTKTAKPIAGKVEDVASAFNDLFN